ncbi:MAG: addiction module protein [Chromatiales bacterium]|jgi:hypothetical protein|nr:addiction module protein [Chromatiales bacterium]
MATKIQIPVEFANAPTEARIAFVQTLWDEIATGAVPVPREHKRVLDERLAASEENSPSDTRSWREVREEVLGGLSRD